MMNKAAVSLLKFSLLALGTAFSNQVFAQSAQDLSVNLNSRAFYSSGTALWNQVAGVIQPTIIVKDWSDLNAGGGNQTTTIDVGDGSDGEFTSSTWAQFGSVDSTNKIIHFDNSAHPILQATRFTLDDGWTLIPTAAAPLKIYVLGDANVGGIIDCNGDDGGSVTTTPGSAGLGGSGHCGGGNGGSGGAVFSSGNNGFSPSGLITSGTGGAITGGTAGAGGGGGGAFDDGSTPPHNSTTPDPASNGGNGSATAGATGTPLADSSFVHLFGSAGGGGGSGSSTQAGAGGGGGGGVIILHVAGNLTIGINGALTARGGKGGTTSNNGGEGGAGGGGSIQTWAFGTFTLQGTNPTAYAIDASGGDVSSASTSNGGAGWPGRSWTVTNSTAGGYVYNAGLLETPASQSLNPSYSYATQSTSQNVITTAIDTQSTLATFHSAGFTSTNDADVTLEISGSNDAFVSDDTGWLPTSSFAELNNKRYVRFRLSINNSDEVTPTTVSQIVVNYTPGLRTDFDFKSAGCGKIGGGSGHLPPPWSGFFIFLPLLAIAGLFHRLKNRI